MMNLMIRTCLFLLISNFLYSSDFDLDMSQMEITLSADCEPLAAVAGCVNVASGRFFQVETDFAGNTIDAIEFQRFYDSGNKYETFLGRGFGCQHPLLASKVQDGRNHSFAMISERDGTLIPYRGRKIETAHICKIDRRLLKKGHTNLSRMTSNAHVNFVNWSAEIDPESNANCWTVQTGDGSRRFYRKTIKLSREKSNQICVPTRRVFLLTDEIKANGNKVKYDYQLVDGKPCLSKIWTMNRTGNTILNSLNISYTPTGCRLKSSCGNTVEYSQATELIRADIVYVDLQTAIKRVLNAVKSSQSGLSVFTMKEKSHYCGIERVEKPEGRFLAVQYNKGGKVLRLLGPGIDGNPVTNYTFSYKKRSTTVKNALGQLTLYLFDSDHRVTQINFLDGSEIVRQEVFNWSKKQYQEGWLDSKSIVLRQRTFQKWSYSYDSKGNVTKKTLYGNLTGEKPESFRRIEETDQYTITYQYSQDARNLLISQSTPQGWTTTYAYLTGTNLKTKKLESYNGKIQERMFVSYDDNGQVKNIIEDDGSSENEIDLTDVTFRRIKKIVAVTDSSLVSFGKPKEILESYLDIRSRIIIPLSRAECFYDPQGREIKKLIYNSQNEFCYQISKEYDSCNRVIKETNALNQVTRFVYDQNNNKVEEELVGSGKVICYEYDAVNRLICKKTNHSNGEVFCETYSFNNLGQLIKETDQYGNETHFTYDRLGRRIKQTKSLMKSSDGLLICPTVQNKYNVLDQKVEETDENGFTTTISYTIYGSPTLIQHPDGSVERFVYYPSGSLKQKWAMDGTSIRCEYDPKGRLVKELRLDGNGETFAIEEFAYKGDLLINKKDCMGLETNYEYDGRGLKIVENIGGIKIFRYEYDEFGRSIKVIYEINGQEERCETYCYDWLNRVVSKSLQDVQGVIYAKEAYQYDLEGNQIQRIVHYAEDSHAIYESVYGSDGSILSESNPLGHKKTYAYDHHYQNEMGQKVLLIVNKDPLGRPVKTENDAHHRIVKKDVFEGEALVSSTQYAYDATGRLIQETASVMVGETYIRDYSVYYIYNSRGLLASEVEMPNGKESRYFYDSMGRLSQKEKPDGVTLDYTYDALGRIQTLTSSDGTINYTYFHDLHDNPIEIHDHINYNIFKKKYDLLNRCIYEELSPDVSLHYTYDSLDRTTMIILPDNSYISYIYDAFHLKKVERYNKFDQLTYTCECRDYDWAGNLLKEITPTGEIIYNYDPLGRSIGIKSSNWESILQEFDSVGNLLQMIRKDPNGEHLSQFTYNRFNHLISESFEYSNQYLYDSLGNILEKNEKACEINDLNQVLCDKSSVYSYDANGNLIAQSNPNITYNYDALNRLISITNEGSITLFTYDAFGRCLLINDDTGKKQLFYQKNQEIGSFVNGKIQELRLIHPDPKSEKTFAIEMNGNVYTVLQDQRYNIAAILNQDGSLAEWATYSSFGKKNVYGDAQTKNPWGFANRREVADLLLFAHRFYNPQIMRWQTTDPLRFEAGLNLYMYVNNNPYYNYDPDGRFFFAVPLIAITFGTAEVTIATATFYTLGSAAVGYGLGCLAYNCGLENILSDVNIDFGVTACCGAGGLAIKSYCDQVNNEGGSDQQELKETPYTGDALGEDPTKCPGEGFQWKGRGEPGSRQGSWYNEQTDESLHPDLDHPPPTKPHWDYSGPNFPDARFNTDGTWGLKK